MTCMMDEGDTVDVIYLDFAKAFDCVNHRFLLAKMKSFGLGDAVVRWIEAYLSGRVSRVVIKNGTITVQKFPHKNFLWRTPVMVT